MNNIFRQSISLTSSIGGVLILVVLCLLLMGASCKGKQTTSQNSGEVTTENTLEVSNVTLSTTEEVTTTENTSEATDEETNEEVEGATENVSEETAESTESTSATNETDNPEEVSANEGSTEESEFGEANGPFVWPNKWNVDAQEIQDIFANGEKPRMVYRDATLSGPRTFNMFVSSEGNSVVDMEENFGALLLLLDYTTEEWVPYAASSYEVSEDGLIHTVTLREGLKWSDGSPITIEQYLATYEIETNEELGAQAFDGWFIEGEKIILEALDDKTLQFTFPAQDRIAPTLIAFHIPTPEPLIEAYRSGGERAVRKALKENSDLSEEEQELVYLKGSAKRVRAIWGTETDPSELVMSGPWVLNRYTPDERLTFKRNPHFSNWNVDAAGNPLPYIDEYTITIATQPAQLNLYLAGEIDAYNPSNLDEVGAIADAQTKGDIQANLLVNVSPSRSSSFFTFNWNYAKDPFKQEVFRDKRFRKAMSHLTDREAIVELVNGSAAIPAYNTTYQVLEFFYNPDAPKYEYDPEAAQKLLAEMGFTEKNNDGFLIDSEGNELGFTLATNSGNADREQTIQILAETMRENGINVRPITLDFNLLVDQLLSEGDDRPWEAILISLSGGSRDWPYGTNTLVCEGNMHMYNRSGECMTEEEELITELFMRGRQTLDNDEAQSISYEIQNVYAELQPNIYTVTPLAHYSWLEQVKGSLPLEDISTINGERKLQQTFISQ